MTKIETTNFKRLIGVWKTSGQVLIENQTKNLAGTDTYEFILDGNYILHKADVLMGNEKSETYEVIGLDSSSEKAIMKYFNSKGENGVMTSQINENDFQINGDKIKFAGKINDKNTELVGKWFRQSEDLSWSQFIEMKLEKQ
jgi:hypothetical protein